MTGGGRWSTSSIHESIIGPTTAASPSSSPISMTKGILWTVVGGIESGKRSEPCVHRNLTTTPT